MHSFKTITPQHTAWIHGPHHGQTKAKEMLVQRRRQQHQQRLPHPQLKIRGQSRRRRMLIRGRPKQRRRPLCLHLLHLLLRYLHHLPLLILFRRRRQQSRLRLQLGHRPQLVGAVRRQPRLHGNLRQRRLRRSQTSMLAWIHGQRCRSGRRVPIFRLVYLRPPRRSLRGLRRHLGA